MSAHSELLQTQVFHYVGLMHKGGEGLRGQLLKWTRTSSSAPTYGGPLVSLAKKTMPLHESPGLVVAPRSLLSTRGNHQRVRAASHRYPCAHPAAKQEMQQPPCLVLSVHMKPLTHLFLCVWWPCHSVIDVTRHVAGCCWLSTFSVCNW